MRTHRQHQAFTAWLDPALLRDVVSAQTLAAARLEPITHMARGGAFLDLIFQRDERIAVVPLLQIAGEMLEAYESSPFLWPRAAASGIPHEVAVEIERVLRPWIESHAVARPLTGELVRTYGGDASRALFDAARELRFIGAASYDAVLADAAPYVYAARFARDKRVAIRDPRGALGAMLLLRSAFSVHADLGGERANAMALQWFGKRAFGAVEGAYDVSIAAAGSEAVSAPVRLHLDGSSGERTVNVAAPIPSEVMVSFDPDDAPPVRTFGVDCEVAVALRGTRGGRSFAEGGSAGRILILVRDDAFRTPDSDSEDAHELARRLNGEGFTADVRAASTAADPASYDLVHAFAGIRPQEFVGMLSRARAAGLPVVVTAAVEDVAVQGVWGSGIVPTALSLGADEAQLVSHLELVAAHRLEADGYHPKHQEPFVGYGGALRDLYALADSVLVSGPAEEALVRRYGFTGQVAHVQAYLNTMIEPEPIAHIAGTAEFALAHAPVEGRSNLFMAVRAALANDIPLVIAGPINDASYYHALLAWGDERISFVPQPSPGEIAALYRRARVFVDVSWIRFGLRRSAQAAVSGCALLTASGSYAAQYWRPGLWEADPAGETSVSRALGDAWYAAAERRDAIDACAERVAGMCDPRAALVATVQAYAHAAARPKAGA